MNGKINIDLETAGKIASLCGMVLSIVVSIIDARKQEEHEAELINRIADAVVERRKSAK